MTSILPNLTVSIDQIQAFCQRWHITEFALFGSVLRDDFRPDSDIDVLVIFTEDAPWTVLDLVIMQDNLEKIVGRKVDLIEKKAIEKSDNWIRRDEILNTAQIVDLQAYEVAR